MFSLLKKRIQWVRIRDLLLVNELIFLCMDFSSARSCRDITRFSIWCFFWLRYARKKTPSFYLLFELGRGVGLMVSSFIYTRFQPRLLFLIFAIGNGAAAIAYSLCFRLCKKHLQKPVRMTANANIPKIVIDSGKDQNEIFSVISDILFHRRINGTRRTHVNLTVHGFNR